MLLSEPCLRNVGLETPISDYSRLTVLGAGETPALPVAAMSFPVRERGSGWSRSRIHSRELSKTRRLRIYAFMTSATQRRLEWETPARTRLLWLQSSAGRLDDFYTNNLQPYAGPRLAEAGGAGVSQVPRYLFLDARFTSYHANVATVFMRYTF